MASRVSQVALEALRAGTTPRSRVSQVSLELLRTVAENYTVADGVLSFDGEAVASVLRVSSWQISVVLPDGTIATRRLQTTGDGVTVLNWLEPLPVEPLPGAIWLLSSDVIAPTLWRVLSVTEDELPAVAITALAHDPNKYVRVEQGLELDSPPTTLYSTGPLAPPSNIQTSEGLYLAPTGVEAKADISWSPSPDPRVEMYEVEIMASLDGTAWQPLSMTSSVTVSARQLAKGQYSVRVRSVSSFWPPSDWVSVVFQFGGLFVPPSDVQNLWSNVLSETILLGWDAVTDIDVDHYQIRYQPAGQTPLWDAAMVIVERVPGTSTRINLPAVTGTYLIKAIDLSGIPSVNAASTAVLVGELPNLRFISDLTEQDPWSGTLDNLEVDASGDLRLVKGSGGLYEDEGWYYFAAGTIDYGDKVTVRLTPNLDAQGESPDLTIQAWWDAASSPWSTAGMLAAMDVRVEVAVSNDNSTWSPWTPLAAGDFEGQYFKYRVHLRTYLPSSVTPSLHSANVNTVGTDRVERGDDVTIAAGGTHITYPIGFFAPPSIIITGQGLSPGDHYVISAADEFGFTIAWLDSGGTAVSRSIDWLASGFGKRKAA